MSPFSFTNLLVAIDGSECSRRAIDCALSLCEALGARLTALAVEGKLPAYAASLGEVDEVKREKDAFFGRVLDDARAQARDRRLEIGCALVSGHAAEVIAHYAKAHDHDLIVIGTRGHFLRDHMLGSTADRVVHHAHCPVMVIR